MKCPSSPQTSHRQTETRLRRRAKVHRKRVVSMQTFIHDEPLHNLHLVSGLEAGRLWDTVLVNHVLPETPDLYNRCKHGP